MKSDRNDIEIISETVSTVVGNTAWGVKIGLGSFLTIEFGEPVISKSNQVTHGEWHLWLYLCSWRIEKDGFMLVGSEDPQKKMTECVKQIEGCRLISFQILPYTLDVILTFEKGLILRLFSVISEDDENTDSPHWILYLPGNQVVEAGPGGRWSIEDSIVNAE